MKIEKDKNFEISNIAFILEPDGCSVIVNGRHLWTSFSDMEAIIRGYEIILGERNENRK